MITIFPILAAVLYGLGYLLIEKSMPVLNVATYMFVGGVISIITAFGLSFANHEPISMSFLSAKPHMLWIVFGALIAPTIGWVLAIYAVQGTSAVYTAFAEISYPLFVILFAFLLFGVRQFDWSILIGGGLTLLGSLILVYGQMKTRGS